MTLPLLREELDLMPGPVLPDGQPSWTLHDPVKNHFYRIDWLTFEILSRWSLGTPEAIVESVASATTLHPGIADVERVVQFLLEGELIRVTGRDSASKMAERLKAIEGTLLKWLLHHYLYFRVPLVRPDGWLSRWRPVADLFYGRGFAILTLIVLVSGLALVIRQSDVFFATLVDTFNFEGLISYGFALFFVKLFHELGHAFTAKRFGCRVPAMGVAFIVLWPMAFTDTNEAWRLTDNRQRLKVSIAGIVTELVIAIWATLAWGLLPDGGLRGAAFVLATTSWVATLAINASPFMRFDGYFILCDWLDMPNLHGRSFALARWKMRELLFALGDPKPEYFSRRKELTLICFAWVTWIYRFVVFLGIAALVYHMFFKALGIFLFMVEIAWFIVLPVYREILVWKEFWPRIRRNASGRQRVSRVAACAGVVFLLFIVPFPGRVSSSGILRPAETSGVFLPAGGRLIQVNVPENAALKSGSELFRAASPELLSREQVIHAKIERLRWQAVSAGFTNDARSRLLVSQEEWATAEAERASIEEELQRYSPVSPFDGKLRDLDPDLHPGQWISARERIAVIVGHGRMQVETYLDEDAVRRVSPGDGGIFITDGLEGPVLRLRVTKIDADVSRVLPSRMLAAEAGGSILTRERKGQRLPEHAIYRVLLDVESRPGDLAQQSWRGRVVIRADAQALASRYLRQLMSVLIRESGW